MTELERKLAETLRAEAEEIRPSPDAWAVHQQRVRRRGRRRTLGNVVVVFGVAAVLVLLAMPFLRMTPEPRKPDTPVGHPAPPVVFEEPDSTVLAFQFPYEGKEMGVYFQVKVKGVLGTAQFCLDAMSVSSAKVTFPRPTFPGCVAGTLPSPGDLSPTHFDNYGKWVYLYSPQATELKVTARNGDDLPVTDVARGPDYVLATVPSDKDNPPDAYETRDEHGEKIKSGSLP